MTRRPVLRAACFHVQMARRSYAALRLVAKGFVLLCVLPLSCGIAAHPCAAFGCGSSRVAASGGQGGLGGLRVPPRPSLDSPLPLETPPLRYGVGGGGALRSGVALCLVAKGWCGAWRSSAALWASRRILAPHLAAIAAVWQPPAAKEGYGDFEFPLLPPWILFLPLCTAAAPLRGWRRRGAAFLRGALPQGQRGGVVGGALRSCVGS